MCTDSPRAAPAPVSFGNMPIILTLHVRGPGESGGSAAGSPLHLWQGQLLRAGSEAAPSRGWRSDPTPQPHWPPACPGVAGRQPWGPKHWSKLSLGLPRRDWPTEVSCLSLGRREDLGLPLGLGREPGDSGIAKAMSPVILRSPSSCNRLIKHLVSCPALPPDGELPGQPAHQSNGQPRARRQALRSYR